MTATPIWFGPEERPLFGWLHVPDDDRVRRGVVLCAPVGYEEICAHRTFRELAEHLADAGFAALRFDYGGTGDSTGGHEDPDRLDAWNASIDAAIAVLRDTGATSIAGIGMRLGATLVASRDLDAVVLWDPVWSGRRLVRQLRALTLLGAGDDRDADDGSMAVAGTVYSAQTLAELRSLVLPDLTASSTPMLVLVRGDQPAVDDDLALLPAHAEVGEATDQAELLDGPSISSKLPRAALDRIVAWLTDQSSEGLRPETSGSASERGLARRVNTVDGESFVQLGPLGLFGIVTERDADPGKPVIALLNNSIDHHVGPSRLWVDWGREMAAQGFAVARVDISGVGDSPARPGQPIDRPYPLNAVDDVVAIVAALDRGAGVVLGGLCSGARNAIDAAAVAPVRGVLAINPPLHASRELIRELSTEDPNPAALVALHEYKPIRHQLMMRTPKWLWRLFNRLHLIRSHAEALQTIVGRATDTLVVYGEDDFFGMIVKRTSAWHLDELARHDGFVSVTIPRLDHGLMGWGGRAEVARTMTEHLLSRYGVRATTWNQSTADTSSPTDTLRPSSRA